LYYNLIPAKAMGFLNSDNMSEISYYSAEGLKKLKEELVQLEQVERPRVTVEIADARDKGDLSENAEYHAAKEEQSHLEFKIAKLKNVISSARILDESQLDTSKVLIHSNVVIKNTANGMEFKYRLVADSETDVRNGKLSVNSPIGKGLLGAKVGDISEIQVPSGVMKFEIISISRS
jgi:transcription elongation factor GreA|tara:strand:- start:135 stop:665 length:531 start_codon:yes stop_codon:yes gene_type:complete